MSTRLGNPVARDKHLPSQVCTWSGCGMHADQVLSSAEGVARSRREPWP